MYRKLYTSNSLVHIEIEDGTDIVRFKRLVCLLPFPLLALMILPVSSGVDVSYADTPTEYTYYGYAPVGTNVTILVVVGINDFTTFEVVDLTTGGSLGSGTIDRMEMTNLTIRSARESSDLYFKAVSDKPVAALLMTGYLFGPSPGWFDTSFDASYPATSGGLVGEEFIFMATPLIDFHKVVAFEEADVQLLDTEDNVLWEGSLKPGETKDVPLIAYRIYRVVSTGRISIQSWKEGAFNYLTDTAGSFSGKYFVGMRVVSQQIQPCPSFTIVIPYEASTVKVYGAKSVVGEKGFLEHEFTEDDVQTQNYWRLETGVRAQETKVSVVERVVSTGKVSVLMGSWSYHSLDFLSPEIVELERYIGGDIKQLGAKAGEELRFYAPTGAVVFFPQSTSVKIDRGPTVAYSKDDFVLLRSGVHVVQADSPVIVEVFAAETDLTALGTYLLSVRDIELPYEPLEVPIVEEGGFPTTIVIAAAAAVIIVAATIITIKRRR